MKKTLAFTVTLLALSASCTTGTKVPADSEMEISTAIDRKAVPANTEDPATYGITILFGLQDVLRLPDEPTTLSKVPLVSTRKVAANNTIVISRSNIIFTQDDKDFLINLIQDMIQKSEPSKDGDAILTSAIMAILGAKSSDSKMVTQIKSVLGCRKDPEMMRQCIQTLVNMKKSGDSDDKQEVHHGYGYRVAFRYPYQGRYLYGWRYPLDYWRLYGCKLYPATCGYGHIIGAYYYC